MSEEHTCKNCGAVLHGEFCSRCGQRNMDVRVPLKNLAAEFVEEFLMFDTRLIRSIVPFLFKPGLLTLEYVEGRRTRFLSPFKFYFFMSFLFFFVLAIQSDDSGTTTVSSGSPAQADSVLHSTGTDSLMQRTGADTLIAAARGNSKKFTVSGDDSAKIVNQLGARFYAGYRHVQRDPQYLINSFRQHASQAVFLMLPIFALLLKILYARRSVLYIQHIVLAFHFHAFIFFIFLVLLGLSNVAPEGISDACGLLIIAVPAYLLAAMRRVYQQGWVKTVLKFLLLVISYFILVVIATLALMLLLIALA